MQTLQFISTFILIVLISLSFLAFVFFYFKKNKKASNRAFLVFILSITTQLLIGSTEFWKVDTCLDSGGTYNYEEKMCEH